MTEVVNATVDLIQKDYFDDFLNVYGLTIALTETHPEQANNEVRNALTHIGRALNAPKEDAHGQISAAKRHFKRAKLDCLKLCVVRKQNDLHNLMSRIEVEEGFVPRPIKVRLKGMMKLRRKIFTAESAGDDVADTLEKLLMDMLEMEDELLSEREIPRNYLSKYRIWAYKLKRFSKAASFAIVCSVLAAVVFVILAPEKMEIVIGARQAVAEFISPVSEDQEGQGGTGKIEGLVGGNSKPSKVETATNDVF